MTKVSQEQLTQKGTERGAYSNHCTVKSFLSIASLITNVGCKLLNVYYLFSVTSILKILRFLCMQGQFNCESDVLNNCEGSRLLYIVIVSGDLKPCPSHYRLSVRI